MNLQIFSLKNPPNMANLQSSGKPAGSPIYAMFYIFMRCFIYLCHDLHIFAMFYIFMPCFIYVCEFQYMLQHYSFMLHQDFHFCCIVFFHLCCINANLCGINTKLCCINLTNLCCIKICQQFHFFHHHIQWEVINTCSSLWSYLPHRVWDYKA